MADRSRSQLLTRIKDLLTSGNFSDLTVVCGPDTYKVHKNVVCSGADFFARAINFGGKEAETSKIELPDDEPEIIERLMQYLYEGGYDPKLPDGEASPPPSPVRMAQAPHIKETKKRSSTLNHMCKTYVGNGYSYFTSCPHHCQGCNRNCHGYTCDKCKPLPATEGTPEQLVVHAKMYELADKYNVSGLKDLVKEKFHCASAKFWDEPAFAVAAYHVYSTTPDHDKGLRDTVSRTILEHAADMIKKPEIEALLNDFNGLAFELFKARLEMT